MPHSAAQACWTYLADVNLGSTAWPPNDQRCAYRHATLRRAQLACERTPLCVGVARDSDLPCLAAGGVDHGLRVSYDTVLLRFELRGAGRQPWPGMKAWLLSRSGGVSGTSYVETNLAQPLARHALQRLLSAPKDASGCSKLQPASEHQPATTGFARVTGDRCQRAAAAGRSPG